MADDKKVPSKLDVLVAPSGLIRSDLAPRPRVPSDIRAQSSAWPA